jgi:hypothetical protein
LEQGAAIDVVSQILDRNAAFTRRTFFWLSTSWEKGMSREELSTSFGKEWS